MGIQASFICCFRVQVLHVRERILNLVAKAFISIPVAEFANMIG